MRTLTVTLALLLAASVTIHAQTLEQTAVGLENVVNYFPQDAIQIDNTLAISTSLGLVFYDVSDPFAPELVSTWNNLPSNNFYGNLATYEGYLYTERGVFDISDPTQPDSVGSFWMNKKSALFTSGGHEYLVRGTSFQFSFYDIQADPINPPLVLTLENIDPGCGSVIGGENRIAYQWTSGGYDSETHVRTVDVTDLENPQRFPLHVFYVGDYWPIRMHAYGDAFYVITSLRCYVYNFANGAYTTTVQDGVFAYADNLMLTNGFNAINIFSLDDPLHPQLIHVINEDLDFIMPFSGNSRMSFLGRYGGLYAQDPIWMDVLDLTDPLNPEITPSGLTNMQLRQVVADGDRCYTRSVYEGMWVSDFSDPQQLDELNIFSSAHIQDLQFQGDHLYFTQDQIDGYDEGIITIDVSDPMNPTILDYDEMEVNFSFNTCGFIGCNDDYLFVTTQNSLRTYRIDNPDNPDFLSEYTNWPSDVRKMDVDGNTLYVLSDYGDQLRSYDVSDPEFPNLLDTIDLALEYQLDQFRLDQGRVAAVRDFIQGGIYGNVVLIDAANPADLQIAHEFPSFGRTNYKISFDFEGDLFFLGIENEIQVYDVSDLYDPVLLTSAPSEDWPHSLHADGDKVYALIEHDIYQYTMTGGIPNVRLELTAISNTLPPEGGDIVYDAEITNNLDQPLSGSAWVTVTLPNNNEIETFRGTLTAQPGTTLFDELRQTVPSYAPAGQYTLTGRLGLYPNYVAATDAFTFTKNVVAETGASSWTHSEWTANSANLSQTGSVLPRKLELSAGWPNPFNPSTSLTLSLTDAADVNVAVFNVTGQLVTTLADSRMTAGAHTLTWAPDNTASGVYFVRALVDGNPLPVRKLVYMR